MYGNRTSMEYIQGVEKFAKAALRHQEENHSKIILCPCVDCNNSRGYRDISEIKDHLIRRGFRADYRTWNWHGEIFNMNKQPCSEDNLFNEVSDEEVEEDRIDDMMHDVEDEFTDRPHIFDEILKAAEKPLYPSCTSHTKLSVVMKLFNLKARHN